MKHLLKLGILGAALLAGGALLAAGNHKRGDHAHGDHGRGGKGMTFERLDADGNGELTREEIASRGMAQFAQTDADGDGRLTAEEIEAHVAKQAQKRAARMIERHDTNGDGAIDRDEMTARSGQGRMFDRLDADGDGVVTRAEFDAARSAGMGHGGRHGQEHKH